MMSTIRECYLSFLQETDFYNPEYCTKRLKEKLQTHYGELLAFHFEEDEIVYSNSISVTEAIAKFHNSSSTEKVKVEPAAMILRRTIKQAFKSSEPLPWPPSAEFLSSGTIRPPELLTNFLNCLLSGSAFGNSQNTKRLASSFGLDLCRAVTNGK